MPDPARHRHRSLLLFLVLLATLCSAPLWESHRTGAWILAAAYAIIAAVGGYVLLRNRSWLLIFVVLAVVALGGDIAHAAGQLPDVLRLITKLAGFGIFALLMWAVLAHSFFNAEVATADRLLAGISGYLLVIFAWTSVFTIIEIVDADAFSSAQKTAGEALPRFSLLYYSMVTVSTLGYGDIVPATSWARLAGGLAGLSGTLYLAVFIAAIISGLRVGKKADNP